MATLIDDGITDVDLVRWAFVKVLMVSPIYKGDPKDGISRHLFAKLIAATPRELQILLEIDDFAFAKRVHYAIKVGEASRKK